MKLNVDKCKFMIFNHTVNYDFVPNIESEGNQIETMEDMRLLGLTIRNDLKWKSNTNEMVRKGYKRQWMMKRLKYHGANLEDLIEVYTKQIRGILGFGVPVWNGGLTKSESYDIERVQKAFLHNALGPEYQTHDSARKTKFATLESRGLQLCVKVAKRCTKHPKHKAWFKPNENIPQTRSAKPNMKELLYNL